MGTTTKRVLIDQVIPTKREMKERKPDLVVKLKDRKYIEVACPWAMNMKDRELEKEQKYQELAADMATQYDGYRVRVFPGPHPRTETPLGKQPSAVKQQDL